MALPILGVEPVTGLDDEADTPIGYRSPVHGRRPEVYAAATRDEESAALAERVRAWMRIGIEPHAIGVAVRAGYLADQARDALKAVGIRTVSLTSNSTAKGVRAGTMHGMKGLEFQAVAVIGVEERAIPAVPAVTPEDEDPLAQDLQRERCVFLVACTRARDQLFISYTGVASPFLSPGPAHRLITGRRGD